MRGILGGSAAHMQGPPTLIARSSRLCRRISATPTGRHVAQRRAVLATAAARSPSLSSIDLDGNNPLGEKYMLSNGMIDYYALLGVDDDATPDEVKRAYRSLAKQCHPDFLGDEGHDICILLNEAYQVLSEPVTRDAYNARLEAALKDDEDDFTGQLLSKWMPATNPAMAKNTDPNESRGVFVDEFTCIGCRNCCNVCPSTFAIEDDWGRARVMRQDADPVEKQQEAIDTCPVNCIHWVSSSQLSLLDVAMARMGRVSVWSMAMSGAGSSQDVFTEASLSWQKRFQELRQRRAAAAGAAAMRSTNSAGSKQGGGWWNNIVSFEGATGSQFYEQNAKQAEEAYSGASKEGRSIAALAAKAARASRTWRVYQETANAVRKAPRALSSTSSASSMDDV